MIATKTVEEWKTIEELIEECKQAVIKACGKFDEATERRWLEAHAAPYENERYRVQLFILEGTPVRGYVVADRGHQRVQAFGYHGQKLKQLNSLFSI